MDTDITLIRDFVTNHPIAASKALEAMDFIKVSQLIEDLPNDLTRLVLHLTSTYKVARCVEYMSAEQAVVQIEIMDERRAELVMRQVKDDFREEILGKSSEDFSAAIRKKLSYPSNSIGAIMSPFSFGVRRDQTTAEVCRILREDVRHLKYVVPVVDLVGELEGIIVISDLIYSDALTPISTLMKADFPRFFPEDAIDLVIDHPEWDLYHTMLITDKENHLLGLLEYDTVSRAVEKLIPDQSAGIVETGNELSELYRLGMTGFLQIMNR